MTAVAATVPPLLRCPRTHAPLIAEGDGLHTGDGRVTYRVERGVPDLRFTRPASPGDEAAIDRMTADAEATDWRSAVEKHRPDLMGYIDNERRTIFFDLLPLTPSTVSLEIGPGLGQLLVPLSLRVREAYAVELSPAQARFAAMRARQEGRKNVFIAAGGDDLLLPFADDAFDVVVLNQVFEWVRLPEEDGGAHAGQKLVLREIMRVLKPGGVCFLATKNRYALRYLLGGRDENAREIRFGNALPRWLMRRLTAKRTNGWMGLLHSHRGLRKMITEAGFTNVTPFWAGPDPRFPNWYIPADADSIRAARKQPGFTEGAHRSTRLLMPLLPAPIVKHFTPGHAFLLTKPIDRSDNN